MSRIGNAVRIAVRSLERDLGNQVFVWNGNPYMCVENTAEATKDLGLGGFELVADLTLFVRLEKLPETRPAEKQTIVFRGRTYRIDKVAILAGESVMKLTCNSPTRGSGRG